MSLDVTVLDDRQQVVRSVGFGVDEHWEIVRLAEAHSLPIISRLNDYYSDAEVSVGELPAFLKEVEEVIPLQNLSASLRARLEQLAEVIHVGISEGRPVVALAD